jgi:hypothetical protein
MAKTVKIVKASIGSYTDKDGKTKNRYRAIGSVIATSAGEMLVLDMRPWDWDGRAFLNDPEPDDQPRYQRQPRPQQDVPEDDIPF